MLGGNYYTDSRSLLWLHFPWLLPVLELSSFLLVLLAIRFNSNTVSLFLSREGFRCLQQETLLGRTFSKYLLNEWKGRSPFPVNRLREESG